MKLVSIIVPIYNVAPYLRKCMDSLVMQSYSNIEIIAVNDGSLDESGKIAHEYANKYPFVQVIDKANGGLSSARNAGLEVAKGEYIAFIDSDDYVSENYVEVMAKALDKGYDYAECHNVAFDGNGKEWDYEYQSKSSISKMNFEKERQSLIYVAMFVRGNMYKRELLANLQFPNGLIHEDIYYSSILFHRIKKIAKVEETNYYYLLRSNSIANHASPKMFEMYDIMKAIHAYYENQGWKDNLLLSKIYVRSFLIAVLFKKASYLPKENESMREMKRQEAIRTLHEYYPAWWLNTWITPKEKVAVCCLHISWVMNYIWRRGEAHE